jgi:hypothetical protein
MANNPKHKDNLKPFKKGKSGNPRGRPKKIENIIKELFQNEYNFKLSKGQADEIIVSLLGKTKKQLIELANNETLPFWISLIANKAKMDFKNGSIELIEKLFDRVYGRPQIKVETSGEAENTVNIIHYKIKTTPEDEKSDTLE